MNGSKEPRKIKFQPGFSLVLGATLIAVFVGFGIRIFFSSRTLSEYAQAHFESLKDRFEIDLGTMRLSLANGAIPRIAFELEALHLKTKGCGGQDTLALKRVLIPIRIWTSLFSRQLSLGQLSAELVRWEQYRSFACEPQTQIAQGGEASPTKESVAASTETSLKPPQSNEVKVATVSDGSPGMDKNFIVEYWQKIHSLPVAVPELSIDELILVPIDLATRKEVVLRDFKVENLNSENEPLVFSGLMKVVNLNPELPEFPETHISGEYTRHEIKIEVDGRWKEGELEIISSLKFKDGTPYFSVDVDLKNIPVSLIAGLLSGSGWLDPIEVPKKMWFTCQGNLEGPLAKLESQPWEISNCRIDGELGKITVEKMVFPSNLAEVGVKPFLMKLTDLDVRGLLGVFRKKYSEDQYSALGKLSGTLDVKSLHHLEFQGALQGLDLMFSNGGVRRPQSFPNLAIRIELKDHRVSGLVDQIKIEGGEFKGSLSFNLKENFADGLVQVRVDELSFSPVIQKLMVSGEMSPLAFYGQFSLEEGQAVAWHGQGALAKVASGDFRLSNAKVSVSSEHQRVFLKGEVGSLEIRQGGAIYKFLQPIFLDHRFEAEWVLMSQFNGKCVVGEDGFEWTRADAFVNDGKITLSSQGRWDSQGQLNGWISSDFPALKLLKWRLTGERGQPRLEPQIQWLKELGKKEPKELSPSKSTTGNAGVETGGLKAFGDMVISGAKKIISNPEVKKKNIGAAPKKSSGNSAKEPAEKKSDEKSP